MTKAPEGTLGKRLQLVGVFAICLLFAGALLYQVNLWPGERFPNWDWAWVDARSMNVLDALRRSLRSLELPSIDLRTNLGYDFVGDFASSLNPLNLLVLLTTHQVTIFIRSLVIFAVGAFGAFLFTRQQTKNLGASWAAAFLYLSLPIFTGMSLFNSTQSTLLALPWLLIVAHRIADTLNWRRLAEAWAVFVLAVSMGDIHTFVVIAPIALLYMPAVGILHYRIPWRAAGQRAVSLITVLAGASAFYVLPVLRNLKDTGSFARTEDLGFSSSAPTDYWHFLRFNGLDSFLRPFEGSGLLLYCPVYFIVIALFGYLFRQRLLDRKSLLQVALLHGLALALFLSYFLVNSSLLMGLVGESSDSTRGIIRAHLNVIPFLLLLAGIIGVTAIVRQRNRGFIGDLIAIGVVSLTADYLLLDRLPFWYGSPAPLRLEAPFASPARFTVDFGGSPMTTLVWIHFVMYVVLIVAVAASSGERISWRSARVPATIGLGIVALLTVGTQMEVLSRSDAPWHWVTSSTHRLESFEARQECLASFADLSDPQSRVLYVGEADVNYYSGRDWDNLLETELHGLRGQRSLFSYREFDHPMPGVLAVALGQQRGSGLYPPLTERAVEAVNHLRLLGVRYVVGSGFALPSSNRPNGGAATSSDDFQFLGSCTTPLGPSSIADQAILRKYQTAYSSAGTTLLYEISDAPGIYYLANRPVVTDQPAALLQMESPDASPWDLLTGFDLPADVGGVPDPVAVDDVEATVVDTSTLRLAWTSPADNYIAIDQYVVYAVDCTTGDYTGEARTTPSAVPTLAFDGLEPGTSYRFAIRAHNDRGLSNEDDWDGDPANLPNTDCTKTPGGVPDPVAVDDVEVTVVDASTLRLVWTSPADNYIAIDQYVVYAVDCTTGDYTGEARTTSTSAPTLAFDGLEPGTSYRFAIRARNDRGLSNEDWDGDPANLPNTDCTWTSTAAGGGGRSFHPTPRDFTSRLMNRLNKTGGPAETGAPADQEGPDSTVTTVLPDATFGRTVLIERMPEGFDFTQSQFIRTGTAEIIQEGPSAVTIEVESDSPTILVAAFAYRAGWHAYVDGTEVDVLRTYGGFLGVAVPEGRHFIVLDYSSNTLAIGLVITLFSGFCLAWLAWQEARNGHVNSRHKQEPSASAHPDADSPDKPSSPQRNETSDDDWIPLDT